MYVQDTILVRIDRLPLSAKPNNKDFKHTAKKHVKTPVSEILNILGAEKTPHYCHLAY